MGDTPRRRAIPLSLFDIRHSLVAVAFCAVAVAVGCASKPITADPVYFPSAPSPPRVVHLKSFNRVDELVRIKRRAVDVIQGRVRSASVGTPAGIAYRNGHLYICDTDLNILHDWDLATGQTRRIGLRGEVILAKPVAVTVDEEGTVYVADTERGEVIGFASTGGRVRRFRPLDREGYRPVSVAVRDGRLYVADIHDHRVDVFSVHSGDLTDWFGGTGSEPGRLYFPMGVATNYDGRILVSDMMNGRVQVFDPDYRLVLSMGRPGNRYGDLGKPRHLAVAPDGVVFIADTAFAHVHLFNEKGQLMMMLGGPEDRLGGTPMPIGVAIAPDLPESLGSLVPDEFLADYYLFVANSIGTKRISLYAVGSVR